MKYSRIAAACMLASTFAGIAHAEDDAGFYLGGGLGQAREESSPYEGNNTSYRVFGGYSFNRYFSAEAGYIDGGTTYDDIGPYRVTVERAGLYATGIAKLPIGKYFAPFGKFGYVVHHTLSTLRVSDTENDSDFIYGGGLELKLGENFRLRAEYDKVTLPDSAFDIFSLNAAYKF